MFEFGMSETFAASLSSPNPICLTTCAVQ